MGAMISGTGTACRPGLGVASRLMAETTRAGAAAAATIQPRVTPVTNVMVAMAAPPPIATAATRSAEVAARSAVDRPVRSAVSLLTANRMAAAEAPAQQNNTPTSVTDPAPKATSPATARANACAEVARCAGRRSTWRPNQWPTEPTTSAVAAHRRASPAMSLASNCHFDANRSTAVGATPMVATPMRNAVRISGARPGRRPMERTAERSAGRTGGTTADARKQTAPATPSS